MAEVNYLKEIVAFYDWLDVNSLSPTSICLWHALMSIANKTRWQGGFSVAISTLCDKTKSSRDAVYRARNQLKQLGRIDFKERKGNLSAIYFLIPFVSLTATQSATQTATQSATQTATQSATQTATINKQNVNVNKKENIKRKIAAYTSDEQLTNALNDFIKFRSEIKKPVTITALSAILNKLDKYSAGYQAKTRYKCECLNESIANNWRGIFELKNFKDDEKDEEQIKSDNDFEQLYRQYEAYARSYSGSIVDMPSFEEWKNVQ